MTTKPWEPLHDANRLPRTGEFVATYADRMAQRELEREATRRLAMAEQTEQLNTPGVRIRAWEQVHDLRMPSDPGHPVLDQIASKTGLTGDQVREEQRARAAARTAKA
jgi:hypothetical protein